MSRPRLRREGSLLPGLAALGLFVVFAATFLTASFPEPAGFGADAEITRSIGAALFNIDPGAVVNEGTAVASEGFLVAFIVIAIALDAALDGSILLARREEGGGAAMADGGRTDEFGHGTDAEAETDGGDD